MKEGIKMIAGIIAGLFLAAILVPLWIKLAHTMIKLMDLHI